MELKLQIVFILSCCILLIIFINMIRKNKLNIKYSLVWLFSIITILLLSIFPQILYYFSALIGIEKPSNLVFVIGILFLGIIIFSLTISQSRKSTKLIKLAQEFAILENELKKIKENDSMRKR